MNLASLLSKERINLSLKPGKKNKVIEDLVYSMKKGTDAELIVSTLLKREELGSTGIGKGIAIPHCRSLAVDKLEIAVGRTTKPINFNAIDKKPVSLIFLIIAPPQDPGNQYLITLGKIVQIAKILTKKKLINKPQTPEEFIALIDQIEKDLRKRK
ncbi:MAG TPA: PTS sugar transporter subunit IIA [candidate division WOR-3 bacterium]|uniref:PTS sugar transporter subunit IIA n=1 Tax=candidate division WOR-3 bacterium TaxID=2052148 RepID=A0A9C9ENM4_UNCW3|nr:PTS sugar transporter subunit IIA [candidate division WOR-3 bacterium]